MNKLRVLVACEFSGIVREAFKARGHDAWSCDLLPTEQPGNHIQDDAIKVAYQGNWDLMIAHPPCTYLSNVGVQHLHKNLSRWPLLWKARLFFLLMWRAPITMKAIENPIPHRYAELPQYGKIIQPFMFGEKAQKKTALWLKGVPPLMATLIQEDRGEKYIGTDGKSNGSMWYMRQTIRDGHARSRTFQGIANAMAEQWG